MPEQTWTSDEVVKALYQVLLTRQPDLEGLEDKIGRLDNGTADLNQVVREFVGSEEFVDKLPELLGQLGNIQYQRFTNDASQYGEVLELLKLWVNAHAEAKVVVDVGARGRARSNSYDLMKHFGWRGLLIEANPHLLAGIVEEFVGLDLQLVSCAVSDFNGSATFTRGINDDVSSLQPDLAAAWGPTAGEFEVSVKTLSSILDAYAVPKEFDLLSIDIEGEDIKVLNDLVANSDYRPAWVIIEASQDFSVRSLSDAPFSEHVKNVYAIKAQTRSNLILGRTDPDS